MKGTALLLLLFFTVIASSYSQSIGLFEYTADVGAVKINGMASYGDDGLYILTGSGSDMELDRDALCYLYTSVSGDFDLRATMIFAGEGKSARRKIGILFRESLDESSPAVFTALREDKLIALQYRATYGDRMISLEEYMERPDVFELERRGDRFVMRYGYGSLTEEVFQEVELELSQEGYIGIYICTHEDDVSETALFTNLKLNKQQ